MASGTTPAPELTQQETEWRRILSTEAQLGFPAGISLSEGVRSLGQLTPLEFAVTNNEKGLKISPGRQETVTIEAFLQHLLNLASTRTGIEFVCSLTDEWGCVLGPMKTLEGSTLVRWHDVKELLGIERRVGFPFFKQTLQVDQNTLVKLIELRASRGKAGGEPSGMVVEGEKLVVWGESVFHVTIDSAVEKLRDEFGVLDEH